MIVCCGERRQPVGVVDPQNFECRIKKSDLATAKGTQCERFLRSYPFGLRPATFGLRPATFGLRPATFGLRSWPQTPGAKKAATRSRAPGGGLGHLSVGFRIRSQSQSCGRLCKNCQNRGYDGVGTNSGSATGGHRSGTYTVDTNIHRRIHHGNHHRNHCCSRRARRTRRTTSNVPPGRSKRAYSRHPIPMTSKVHESYSSPFRMRQRVHRVRAKWPGTRKWCGTLVYR